MNQTLSNCRNAILAAGFKALLVAATIVAYFASLDVARAQAIKTEDGGISIDLDKPANPGTNNPQPPPSPPANDTPPPPANDAQPQSPPSGDPANTPDTPDGADSASGGSGDVGTEPADGTTDPANANSPRWDVLIQIPELSPHSGPYLDEDAVYAAAAKLSFKNIPHAIWDGSNANGGYYLYIKVPEWTVYRTFNTEEEADDYANELRARHPSERLQIGVEQHRD